MCATCVHPPKVKQKVVKERGKKGFGGRWRAFVRMRTLGAKGRPDLSALSGPYWEAVEQRTEEISTCQALGEAARVTGKAHRPKSGHSAFGASSRNLQARKLQLARQALTAAVKDLDKESGALALGEHLDRMGADMHTCLTVARSALRAASTRETNHRRRQTDRPWQSLRRGQAESNLNTCSASPRV